MEFDAVRAPDQLQFGACGQIARNAKTGIANTGIIEPGIAKPRITEPQGLVELKIGQHQRKVLGLGRLKGQLHKASRRKHHFAADAVIAQIGRTAGREIGAVAPLKAAWQRQGLQARPGQRASSRRTGRGRG